MADPNDPNDPLNTIGGAIPSIAGNIAGNASQMAAYQAVLENLKKQFGDYDKLQSPGFKNLTPQQLGPSALGNIKNDAQSRIDQQAAEAALQNIADKGGLNLADRAALNQTESTLSRNNSARQNSLKNQFAARGQLGSGAELSMDLANNQNAAQNANQHGEALAGEAQKRAVQALLDKAGVARNVSNDQYARDKAAAEANDSINRYNSSMSMDAQRGNNSLLQEGYGDQLQKLHGKEQVVGDTNKALLGQGNQSAANSVGMGNAGSALFKNLYPKSGGGGASNDPGLDTSGTQDLTGNRGGSADLSGGGSLASQDNGAGFDEGPDQWASFQ